MASDSSAELAAPPTTTVIISASMMEMALSAPIQSLKVEKGKTFISQNDYNEHIHIITVNMVSSGSRNDDERRKKSQKSEKKIFFVKMIF